MTSEARELLGDLVVATVELADVPPVARFEDAYASAERWFRLAAMTALAKPTDTALLDELISALDPHILALRRSLEDAGWSMITWEHACVARSAFEGLRDLLEPHPRYGVLRGAIDMIRVEDFMIQRGPQRFVPMAIPDGTPPHHWWWFEALPESERTLVMNERLRNLMPGFTHIPSKKFRALVAQGIVNIHGMWVLRARIPDDVSRPHGQLSVTEIAYNRVWLRHVLEPDPSRRPVDLAASALACARHLACELRRPPYPRLRIIVERLEELLFHQVDAQYNDDFEGSLEPMLVMYSR